MSRHSRMYLPGVPSHVVQRGNDRNPCFYENENYLYFLSCLADAVERYEVSVHAYVLMTNHFHLLMTPSTELGISRVMQLLGNRYVQYINKKYRKSGTLWEGRHKSSLVESERYMLTSYRYIELNPVRAKMVDHPGDYRWSSYRHNATGVPSRVIRNHEVYLRLASTPTERMHCYRELFQTDLEMRELYDIRTAVAFSKPLGSDHFKKQLAAASGQSICSAGKGRPKRGEKESKS